MYASDLYSMVVYGSYTIEPPSNGTGHRSKFIRSRNTSVQLTLWQVGSTLQVLTPTWCVWRTCHVVFAKPRILFNCELEDDKIISLRGVLSPKINAL